MKLLINPRPQAMVAQPTPSGLHFIQQPKKNKGLILSILAGLLIPLIPFTVLSIESAVIPGAGTYNGETVPWWIVFPVLIVCIFFHELLHLLWHPGWGFSKQSSVNIWPQKFQFGVFFDGFMSRSRWLAMRLAPLVGLTLLPTVFLLVTHFYDLPFFWRQFIVLVILVNSLGSGGDLLASIIVYRQVPAQGKIGIWNGRACWTF